MKDYYKDPLELITFRCYDCKKNFQMKPAWVEDAAEEDAHLWRYFHPCPECKKECSQAHWERGLMIAATREKHFSPEERAARAERCRTMEVKRRARFNRMTHGLYAKVALCFPQRPNGYPHCHACPYLEQGCGTWDYGACLHRTELYMRHRIAFQNKDPNALTDLRADMQANLQTVLDDMLLNIIRSGTEIRTPVWYTDAEGNFTIVRYTTDSGDLKTLETLSAHPLLQPLFELIGKNNLSLGDLRMTPKAHEEEQELAGFIPREEESKTEDTLHALLERQTKALEMLKPMLERSQERLKRDPVLLEHQRDEGETSS